MVAAFWGPTNLDEKNNVTTLTWEHASGWKYGDNFAFLDIYNLYDGNTYNTTPPKTDGTRDMYFEWHPRFNMVSILIQNTSAISWFRGSGIATEINVPTVSGEAYLAGVFFDFNLGSRGFIQTNWYVRDTADVEGVAFQFTGVFVVTLINMVKF